MLPKLTNFHNFYFNLLLLTAYNYFRDSVEVEKQVEKSKLKDEVEEKTETEKNGDAVEEKEENEVTVTDKSVQNGDVKENGISEKETESKDVAGI